MKVENGNLIVNVYVETVAQPVNRAEVTLNQTGETYYTDESGKTNEIVLEAPSRSLSESPQDNELPYAVYNIKVTKPGLNTAIIQDVQVFAGETSIQNVFLTASENAGGTTVQTIPEPTLWGDYPPINSEGEGNLSNDGTSAAVLPYVFIPEYIVVHDGNPSNTNAPNYRVNFPDYVKNVASGEIYSTWPVETIKANVYAIISFALNRVYTEWYRSKGYNFDITSVTSYDQKYSHGRTIFKSIADVVDEFFNTYITIGTRENPYLAHYNDGVKLNNPGWLSQWGSKDLGDKGYDALRIIRYYYGQTANLNTTVTIEGSPTSFPGYNLKLGSCGADVQSIQIQLNTIRGNYPAIPVILGPDGRYEEDTKKTVEIFQKVFNLPVTGVVDFATWYKISYIYTAVANLTKDTA